MKITKIEIDKYKSIKEPIEINFYDELPTVLIGRNGSGKTNILEALDAIAKVNKNCMEMHGELLFSYRVHISLSKDDIARLFPDKKIDENKCCFVACSGENGKINRIESEYLVPLLNSEVCKILCLADELEKTLDTYTKQLNKIAYKEESDVPVRSFQIVNFRDSTTNFRELKFQVEFIVKQTREFANSILQSFRAEENSLSIESIRNYISHKNAERLIFKLRYTEPDLAPFEENFIIINKTAIKREITKINNRIRESCDKIEELHYEIEKCAKRLNDALSGRQLMPENNDTFYEFVHEMRKCVASKHFFLQNESNDIIFKSNKKNQNIHQYNEAYVIFETYLNKVYNKANKEELLEQIEMGKELSLGDEDLREFEEYLNSNRPEFERDMYDSISVVRSEGKIPSIVLHEKNGEAVALNSTSAGRRWYFTYYFMKNTLHPGDLFILDEPAAMLHPMAQREVMRELLTLQSNGIKVVYSTHSPYLIPSDWNSVYFVTMEQNGTAVTQENHNDFFKQVSGGDIFTLQEILEKYQRGDVEAIANRCYQCVVKHYKTVEKAADALNLSTETIISWRKDKGSKKFRTPKLETIITIAEKTNLDISRLL